MNNDGKHLEEARNESLKSKDPSSKIGAVIVTSRGLLWGRGYNGFPPGITEDERMNDRAKKYQLVVHAEMRALLDVGPRRAHGGTLYLWGFAGPPCTNCCKHLIEAGIARIVAGGVPAPERWRKELAEAEAMLREAGVDFEVLP